MGFVFWVFYLVGFGFVWFEIRALDLDAEICLQLVSL